MTYSDGEFLMWMRNRLVNSYGESTSTDFVQRLEQIAQLLGTGFGPIDSDELSYYLMVPRHRVIDAPEFIYVMKRDMPEEFRKKRKR